MNDKKLLDCVLGDGQVRLIKPRFRHLKEMWLKVVAKVPKQDLSSIDGRETVRTPRP